MVCIKKSLSLNVILFTSFLPFLSINVGCNKRSNNISNDAIIKSQNLSPLLDGKISETVKTNQNDQIQGQESLQLDKKTAPNLDGQWKVVFLTCGSHILSLGGKHAPLLDISGENGTLLVPIEGGVSESCKMETSLRISFQPHSDAKRVELQLLIEKRGESTTPAHFCSKNDNEDFSLLEKEVYYLTHSSGYAYQTHRDSLVLTSSVNVACANSEGHDTGQSGSVSIHLIQRSLEWTKNIDQETAPSVQPVSGVAPSDSVTPSGRSPLTAELLKRKNPLDLESPQAQSQSQGNSIGSSADSSASTNSGFPQQSAIVATITAPIPVDPWVQFQEIWNKFLHASALQVDHFVWPLHTLLFSKEGEAINRDTSGKLSIQFYLDWDDWYTGRTYSPHRPIPQRMEMISNQIHEILSWLNSIPIEVFSGTDEPAKARRSFALRNGRQLSELATKLKAYLDNNRPNLEISIFQQIKSGDKYLVEVEKNLKNMMDLKNKIGKIETASNLDAYVKPGVTLPTRSSDTQVEKGANLGGLADALKQSAHFKSAAEKIEVEAGSPSLTPEEIEEDKRVFQKLREARAASFVPR